MLGTEETPFLSISDYGSVLSKIEHAWESFMIDGTSSPNLLRSPILQSWQRSKEKHVPFTLKNAPLEMDDSRVSSEKERLKVLFETMNPYLDDIVKTLPNDYMAVTFSNEKGIILDCRSSRKLLDQFQDDYYVPGADWSERAFGTNGIGTALERGKAVQVFAAEHYCKIAHKCNCASAPVREPVSGVILGVLTITAQRHIFPAHNLNWAISEVQKIERALQGRLQEESGTLFNLLFEKADQPGIIFNLDGQICRINKLAQTMFDAKPGYALDNIFDFSVKQSELIKCFNKSFAVVYRKTRQRFIVTVMPWAVGEYRIGGIAFFHQERTNVASTHRVMLSPGTRYAFSSIVGQNSVLLKTIKLAEKASRLDATVLITGETGTGKEVVAQSIHNNSCRKDQTFLSVNCGAIPKELIASELFGFEEGAFTGAQKGGRKGKFEAADGGSLFLDEIGDMPLEIQVYLLRILEEGLITRIGSNKTKPVNVRVICATNKDLRQEVEFGRFREDLYYRINGMEIFLPPLRNRLDDLPLLVEHFLARFDSRYNLDTDALAKLMDYSWPGNIRELKNVVERAAFLSDGTIISTQALCLPEQKRVITSTHSKQIEIATQKELNPKLINQVLQECGGNITLAAQQLRISRMTIYRKMKKFGLNL
ncbi:MAG: hypothetical protein APF81_02600 [Desulfosporosinus sp. BRH_c37]|nr:MAG: hypothetical protein APF81_02600 [Desulfosporosinus sp. BRH_c37]